MYVCKFYEREKLIEQMVLLNIDPAHILLIFQLIKQCTNFSRDNSFLTDITDN